jgi:hypothetical protein
MKWISVEDRLPEKNKVVLCCVTSWLTGEGKVSVSTVRYCGILDGWETLDGEDVECKLARVTNWMPLPEPPTTRRE